MGSSSAIENLVYAEVLTPALIRAGYRPERADTTLNQRAIMQDVIEGIEGAALVLADMTGRNANVFYELGIAHRSNRPTVLLAQGSADIPFDLGAYRTLIYSVELRGKPLRLVEDLTEQLDPLLAAIVRGEVIFANPFVDYQPTQSQEQVEVGGILDDTVTFQEDLPRWKESMERLDGLQRDFSSKMAALTDEMKVTPPELRDAKYGLIFAGRLGALMTATAEKLEPEVEMTDKLELSLEKGVIAEVRAALLGRDGERLVKAREAVGSVAETSLSTATKATDAAAVVRGLGEWAGALRGPSNRLGTLMERVGAGFQRMGAMPALIEKYVEQQGTSP